MQTQPAFGFTQLLTQVVGEIAKAISDRAGETRQQQIDRSLAAVHLIMGFLPRDGIEAMLAGHCVMFHAIMIESLHEMPRDERVATRRGARSELIALNRAFSGNFDRLRKLQAKPAEGQRDTAEARADAATQTKNEDTMRERPTTRAPGPMQTQSPTQTQPMNRAARRQADRALKRTERPRVMASQVSAAMAENKFPGSREASDAGEAAD